MIGRTKDPETLTMYISIMKKLVMYNIFETMYNIQKKLFNHQYNNFYRELIGRFNKCKQLRMSIKKLQEKLSKVNMKNDTSLEEQSKQM